MKRQSSKESLLCGSPALFATFVVAALACAPSVPLQNRPCPCGDGWVCCPSGNVCAEDVNGCVGGSGTAGASGASSGGAVGTGTQLDANIGGSTGGSTGTTPPPSDAGLPALPTPTYAIQSTLLGTWNGYFENFTFPSKSDALSLSLSQNADGTGKISVVLGMGPPPAPPTDPSATWPPLGRPFRLEDTQTLLNGYVEGFAYDAYDVHWEGERVKFVINDSEPWQTYCQLQTSSFNALSAQYQCLGGAGFSGSEQPDGSIVCYGVNAEPNPPVVSCMQAFACEHLCVCDASGCAAQVSNTPAFDITFTGTKGEGNVTIDTGHDVMLSQVGTADGGQP